jgi:hypothetical protein
VFWPPLFVKLTLLDQKCFYQSANQHAGCRPAASILSAPAIVLIQSRCVRKAIQVSLAVMTLFLALVVGSDTHVHQGEGPSQATVVHVHFGVVGHVHGASASGPGISRGATEGPAVYLNAFSTITTHVMALPILVAELVRFMAPRFSAEAEFSTPEVKAHAPPLINSTCPRSPPLIFSA